MKPKIHPELQNINVQCSGCGNKFVLLMAYNKQSMHVEYCNKCHPAYTGIRKISTTGAIEKFANKYKKHSQLTSISTAKKSSDKKEDNTDKTADK